MKDMNDLTKMQSLVVGMRNIFPDDTFNEMVEILDVPEYWEELDYTTLSDDECVDVLFRLKSLYRDYNNA